MKFTSTLALLCFFSLSIFSQIPNSGGPDNFGYTFTSSNDPNGPSYNWFDISVIGTPVTGLADDNFVGPFSITGFPYYTNNPTQFWIGSNGYISFAPQNIASTAASFPAIPTPGGPNNFIAPFLSDLTFSGAGTNPALAYRYDSGDTICVSFINVPFWVNNTNQYGGDNSFQVILNRADSSITFNYQKQLGTPDPVYQQNYISIGIEDGTGSDGLQVYRGDTTSMAFTSVKYEYPTIIQPITDASLNWVENDKSAAKFISLTNSINPTINLKNTGNQDINSNFSVQYLVENSLGSVVALGSTTLNRLDAGKDTTFVAGVSYVPTNAGKYTLRSYITGLANDNTPSNDTNAMFAVVVDTTTLIQTLDYSDGVNTAGGIGWSGGNGGVAVYIEPPYYPAKILASNFFITTTGTAQAGFYSKIYDDNSRTSVNGNLLDSGFVAGTSITANTYHKNTISQNLVIQSGGIYLLWLMDADGINLGRSVASPASRNTYEVLFGVWSDYRDGDNEDFLMGIDIEPVTVGIENRTFESLEAVYPNPAIEMVTILSNEKVQLNDLRLFTMDGREVKAKILLSRDKIQIFKGNLENGTYLMRYRNTSTKIVFID